MQKTGPEYVLPDPNNPMTGPDPEKGVMYSDESTTGGDGIGLIKVKDVTWNDVIYSLVDKRGNESSFIKIMLKEHFIPWFRKVD